jgi:two-component system, cell cycle sensor histidine kinase and response regulator CckA
MKQSDVRNMAEPISKPLFFVPWRKSLETQLTWALMAIVVFTLASVGLGLIWIADRAQRESTYLMQEKSAEKVAMLISDHVSDAMETLRLFSDVDLPGYAPPRKRKPLLERFMMNSESAFSQLALIGPDGREEVKVSQIHSFSPRELKNVSRSPAYETCRSGRHYIGPVYFSPETGLLTVQIARPLKTPRGTGVLAAEVNVTRLWWQVSEIKIGRTGYAYLVDKRGTFIAYQEVTAILQKHGQDMSAMPPVADFMAGRKDKPRVHEYSGLAGEEVIGLHVPVAGVDWAVVVELPAKEAYAGLNTMKDYLMAIVFCGMFVAGGVGFLISRRLVHPIRVLTQAAENIGRGKLDSEFPHIRRLDEVGVLARAFSGMQDELRTLYRGMEKQVADLKSAGEELRASEELYTKLLASLPDIVIRTDMEGRILFLSDSAVKIGGYTREDVVGRSVFGFLSLEDRKRARDNFYATFTAKLGPQEFPFILKKGRRLLFEVNADVLRNADGSPSGMVLVCRDISERRQAAEALRQSEAKYRTIIEEIEDGYQEQDLKGNFTFFNESLRRIFGYTRAEMTGANYRRFMADKETSADIFRVYNRLYRTGIPVKKYECDIVRKDGSRRSIEFFASLMADAEGRPSGFKGIARDVTERQRAEEQYRVVANSSQTGVYILQDGLACFVNPHIGRYSGYADEELLGSRFTDFVHPEDRAMVKEKSLQMIKGTLKTPYEYRIVVKNGEIKWLLETVTSISFRGKRSILGNSMDITEQKKADGERRNLETQLLQSQKLESIGTLAGGIAHDFNNLMMGIQGYASLMLLDMPESHPHHARLKAIETQVKSGAELTRQLLGFARGGRYEVMTTDVNDLVRKTVALYSRTRKEIRIHETYAEGLSTVDVDRGQMDQVLLNILVNAWQAMPSGGDIFVETESAVLDEIASEPYRVPPGAYVRISLRDTGVGMDEKTKRRIFEPFFTTKEMGRGTGLGLASVYGIIRGHGGFVEVNSDMGRGTTFSLYLPASEKRTVEECSAAPLLLKGNETILVVDDEALITEVASEMLETIGYRVITAGSGREALEILRDKGNEVDLVILDMVMPDMGGRRTFELLRTMNPDIPVILATGYSIDGEAKEIMNRGARAFLQKPFKIDDLSQKIRDVMRDSAARVSLGSEAGRTQH